MPPMRKTLPPHFGHVPETAGFPFFSLTCFGFLISTFVLSLTQYAWTMGTPFEGGKVHGHLRRAPKALYADHGCARFHAPHPLRARTRSRGPGPPNLDGSAPARGGHWHGPPPPRHPRDGLRPPAPPGPEGPPCPRLRRCAVAWSSPAPAPRPRGAPSPPPPP